MAAFEFQDIDGLGFADGVLKEWAQFEETTSGAFTQAAYIGDSRDNVFVKLGWGCPVGDGGGVVGCQVDESDWLLTWNFTYRNT